jgi:hypothetical protein
MNKHHDIDHKPKEKLNTRRFEDHIDQGDKHRKNFEKGLDSKKP